MLEISAFYLDKQKSLFLKKIGVYHVSWIVLFQPPDTVIYLNSPSIYGSGQNNQITLIFIAISIPLIKNIVRHCFAFSPVTQIFVQKQLYICFVVLWPKPTGSKLRTVPHKSHSLGWFTSSVFWGFILDFPLLTSSHPQMSASHLLGLQFRANGPTLF